MRGYWRRRTTGDSGASRPISCRFLAWRTARALRDAINVGVTAFEELGGEEEVVEAKRDGRPQAQNEEGRGELPATRKQLNYLEALISDVVEEGIGRFEEMVGKPVG